MRDKQSKEISNKQKAISLATSQEKNKLDFKERAIKSAASWNCNFNKARRDGRRCCMDLQTFTVNYPTGKTKNKVPTKSPVGNYPLALVPGQFTDYFKVSLPVYDYLITSIVFGIQLVLKIPFTNFSAKSAKHTIHILLQLVIFSSGEFFISAVCTAPTLKNYGKSNTNNEVICGEIFQKTASKHPKIVAPKAATIIFLLAIGKISLESEMMSGEDI